VSSQVADNGHVAFAPEIVTRRTTVKAQKRDTLASLAQRHRVSVANLADWNDLKVGASLKAGQSIVMFLPMRASSAAAARPRAGGKVAVSARSTKSQPQTSKKGGTPSKVKKR
jgi:membrane-bound lytic murein transglycosylase D